MNKVLKDSMAWLNSKSDITWMKWGNCIKRKSIESNKMVNLLNLKPISSLVHLRKLCLLFRVGVWLGCLKDIHQLFTSFFTDQQEIAAVVSPELSKMFSVIWFVVSALLEGFEKKMTILSFQTQCTIWMLKVFALTKSNSIGGRS